MSKAAVVCSGLTKSFSGSKAVSNVNFVVAKGEILALLGPSGCGKTTTLRLIVGFERPDNGTVSIDSQVVVSEDRFVVAEKRHVGMVFQEYALFPHLNVVDNIAFGLSKSEKRTSRVDEMLRLVNLDGMQRQMPYELSGGERQRVALARALAPNPRVLLLDEPFSNLDAALRLQVQRETLEILKRSSTTAIFVTHSQEEAMVMGDVLAIMNKGRIEQIDVPAKIFHFPRNRFVADFMGVSSFLRAHVSGGKVISEIGSLNCPKGIRSERDNIEIMVRPTQVSLRPSDSGQFKIVKKTFQGSFYIYDVALPSGSVIKCSETHMHEHEPGSRVDLQLARDDPPTIFVDGYIFNDNSRNPGSTDSETCRISLQD